MSGDSPCYPTTSTNDPCKKKFKMLFFPLATFIHTGQCETFSGEPELLYSYCTLMYIHAINNVVCCTNHECLNQEKEKIPLSFIKPQVPLCNTAASLISHNNTVYLVIFASFVERHSKARNMPTGTSHAFAPIKPRKPTFSRNFVAANSQLY